MATKTKVDEHKDIDGEHTGEYLTYVAMVSYIQTLNSSIMVAAYQPQDYAPIVGFESSVNKSSRNKSQNDSDISCGETYGA